jgi:hypothetical protein
MNSAVICGYHFVITSALIAFTGVFVSRREGRNVTIKLFNHRVRELPFGVSASQV